MRRVKGITKVFLQELEDSDTLASSLLQSISHILKKNPDAEFVFNIMWALHRYKERKVKARASIAAVAKLKAAGRRIGRPAITTEDERVKRIKMLRKNGKSYNEICKLLNVSRSTACRLAAIR